MGRGWPGLPTNDRDEHLQPTTTSAWAALRPFSQKARRVLREIALLEVNGKTDAGVVRAQQLREIVSLTPWMMLGALLNCTILLVHFWFTPHSTAFLLWGVALWLLALFTLLKWNVARSRPPRPTASRRAVIRAIRHAALLGALWGSLPLIVLGEGSEMDRAITIITIVGMSASGSFVLAVLPAAALAHLVVMLLPTLLAMLFGLMPMSVALSVLIVNYFAMLTLIILARYREFTHRLRDRLQLEKQTAALAASMEDVRRAADLATEANRAKSQFLARMSHEIRTPMNGILGMAGLLERSELTSRQRSLIDTMNYSGKALLTIINDLLDFSRIEAGNTVLDKHAFDLHKCFEGAAELLKELAERKGLALTISIEPDVPLCAIGDEGRLRQVLINLIGNALKFTERGGVVIQVEADGSNAGSHTIRCRVVDTGIGIAPEIRPHLFKPFEQGDSSITRRYGGTGLGLSITRGIVKAMGGSIGVDSKVGIGTTVTFTVTLEPAQPQVDEKPSAQSAPLHIPSSFAGLRVLVAEDNPVNQEVALAYLEALGCKACVVEDGKLALDALASQRYDIVLMDCQMPRMDGLTAVRELRLREAAQGLPRTPVVAVTANAYESDRADCLAAGMDDFLSKPYSESGLAAVLARCSRKSLLQSAAA